MQYNTFGNTGIKLSALGFGAMRLPMTKEGDKTVVNDELAIPLMRRAFDLGVNYIDSAPYYCEKQSEIAVGKAIKGYRDKVYITSKNPIENDSGADWTGRLEHSLKQMDVDYIDFYHFWGINQKNFKHWETLTDGPLQAARKALEQGLIKHLCFSFHDKAENLKYIVDSGHFESCLIQYNLLDRSNEENLAYMRGKGLGVVVMGPVGGGRLGAPSEIIRGLLKEKPASTAEMALRFVLANENVHMALSGMENIQMVEENVKIASKTGHLSADELLQVKAMMEENKKLAELYCTACDYCKPCPQNINIPHLFGMMNTHKVYGLTEHAKKTYAEMMRGEGWVKSADAAQCTGCGVCEEKCPQKLPVVKQLKETHATLAG
ncbi:MAG: aldo/keto reductase [Defluviitaleaceae bacterium]|nr:aldo/keto reductase [Defluviitaleaceae bacterium]MCL2239586.1 aldo/keto reductase [Defluviitaleaceae bacterium]